MVEEDHEMCQTHMWVVSLLSVLSMHILVHSLIVWKNKNCLTVLFSDSLAHPRAWVEGREGNPPGSRLEGVCCRAGLPPPAQPAGHLLLPWPLSFVSHYVYQIYNVKIRFQKLSFSPMSRKK